MTDQEQRYIFSKNLQHFLKSRNKKQIDLAEELDVSTATVSDWLTGKKLPRVGKINRISQWLGITISDLLDEHDTAQQCLYDKDILSNYYQLSSSSKGTVLNIIEALKVKE